MITKSITYTDYNGIQQTEEFYFNLSRAELVLMDASVKGGFAKKIEEISASGDPSQVLTMFNDLILKAYGKKSEDGKRFIKSAELREEFEQSEAYSELMMTLMTDAKAASDFVSGLISGVDREVLEKAKEKVEAAKANANIAALPDPTKH